jgi:hypothetical protein
MEPHNPDHYDTREEEAIDFYNHYLSIQIQDLVAEYVSRSIRDEREVTPPLRMAMEERMDEWEETRANL